MRGLFAALAMMLCVAPAAACVNDEPALAAGVAAGGDVALCPGAVILLHATLELKHPGQSLHTQGDPAGAERARLIVADDELATAILSRAANIHIHHLVLDGARSALGIKDGALMELGAAEGVKVDHVKAGDPRGWSVLHLFEGDFRHGKGCARADIEDNEIGPSGSNPPHWADGISLACADSVVAGNTVLNASDGAIVVFGSPGSVVRDNRIVETRGTLLGGINLVDYKPWDGDFSGVKVLRNDILATGGFIKVGVAVGPSVWGANNKDEIRGAAIVGNRLKGDGFGYGIAVDGARDLRVSGNSFSGRLSGVRTPSCYKDSAAAPTPFLRNPARSDGEFQPDFTPGVIRYALCVSAPPAPPAP